MPSLDDIPSCSYSSLESEFLKSVNASGTALKEFANHFAEVQKQSCEGPSKIASTSSAIAHSVASNILAMSTSLLELDTRSKEIETNLIDDIDGILQCLTIEDVPSSNHSRQQIEG